MGSTNNPVETVASATYSALARDLSPITYMHKTLQDRREQREGSVCQRRPRIDEVSVYHFPQTWASTSLGFGGMGGSAMTTAYTTVVCMQNEAVVYFDGRWAYKLTGLSADFMNDVRNHCVKPVDEARYYPVATEL